MVKTSIPRSKMREASPTLNFLMELLSKLKVFRQEAYSYLGRAKDATFELMDAVILTRKADSLADLSLCPVFRRKWSSIYESVQDTRPQRNKLMKLYIKQIEQLEYILLLDFRLKQEYLSNYQIRFSVKFVLLSFWCQPDYIYTMTNIYPESHPAHL